MTTAVIPDVRSTIRNWEPRLDSLPFKGRVRVGMGLV
jgi:hypothetical protein